MPWFADRRPALRLVVQASGLLLAAAAAVGATRAADGTVVPSLDERTALAFGQAAIGRAVPDYTLLDRQGRTVRLSAYRGKPLLVSFVYTGCFEVCPLNTRLLHEAVKRLDSLLSPDRFNVVSIGFNQPFDSPAAMRAFAAQHRIDEPNWEFLSPPAAIVEPLTRDFGFSYVATPAGFDHVVGVTVLDGRGRIYTQVWGDRIGADRLGEPLKQLLSERPLGAQAPLADVLERVRILCTIYDPESGRYRTNYALVFELVGGLGFFLSVALYGLAEWRARRRTQRLRAVAAAMAPAPPAG